MLSAFKNFVKEPLVNGLHKDKSIYYGRFKGTSDFLPLLVKNVVKPDRFFTKARYGQVPLLPRFMQAGRPYPSEFDNYLLDEKFTECFKALSKTGVAILPSYFSVSQCDGILEALGIGNDFGAEADEYKAGEQILRLNDLTLSMWLDMPLVALLGKYLNRFPYARSYPNASVANPNFDSLPTRNINTPHDIQLNIGWHYDTVNLVQFHVLLNDVEEDGSCMQVVAGTHRSHHLKLTGDDYWLSDEYIEKRKYPVVNCAGKKGTVYLFDSNAYHRLRAVKGRPRGMLKCEFTPGNNVLMNSSAVAQSLSGDVNFLQKLTPVQREVLAGLYPTSPFGGFCYEAGTYSADHARI